MGITIKGIIGRKINSSYSGNRLIRVVDAVDPVVTNGSMDFKDGTDTGVEYTYNASGALTSDLNKGISGIDYDINGNMSKVTFSNGNTTEYVYSQSGAKQRVIHGTVTALPFAEPGISTAEAASVSRATTEYIGDFVFRNGVLDRLLFRGGYMDIAGGVPRYHYFATDHLGSVRTVYGEDGVAEQLLTYDLFGGIIPELSTSMGMQPYGYNGKELDHTHGLDWYDYGARHYDSPIGRWTTMDPLCEKYYNVSPYVYCLNNPLKYVDPDGKKVYLYATRLPGASNLFSSATHTFIVVTDQNNNIRGYYAFGSEFDGIKGAFSGRLMQRKYQQDLDVIHGKNTESLKEKIEIAVPENMNQQAFDNKVVSIAESFGNDKRIRYNILPTKSTQGNCNTSSSTILLKSGVTPEYIESIKKKMSGLTTGFNSSAMPWTKEEQERAVNDEKLIQEFDRMLNTTRSH